MEPKRKNLARKRYPMSLNLSNGRTVVKYEDKSGNEVSFTADIMQLKLAFEEVEHKYNQGGKIQPMASFLNELATVIETTQNAVDMTPTLAYSLWTHVNNEYLELQKKTRSMQPSSTSTA
jgi:hypothetical protein